jgi:predicted N-acyltransferase
MSKITVTVCHAAEAIPHAAWDRLCPAGDPFLNADFLTILEKTRARRTRMGLGGTASGGL